MVDLVESVLNKNGKVDREGRRHTNISSTTTSETPASFCWDFYPFHASFVGGRIHIVGVDDVCSSGISTACIGFSV